MINTIFYFVDTFDIYKLKLDNGEISPKTIVFVEDQQAIYKNGKRYGDMGYTDIKNKVVNIINNELDAITAINGAYDDSHITEALNRVHDLIESEQQRLTNLITELDAEILDKVNRMFDDAEWVRNNVAQNEYLHLDMTWLDGEVNAYLQRVGYWTMDDQGNTITQWSKIWQAVDNIYTEVSALTQNVDGRFIAVQSSINLSVDQKILTARTDIDNIYAKGKDVNGLKLVVEWMYSGLKSSAGPDKSIAQLISAGKDSLIGAISELRTQVDHLDENYVATASLETQVLNIIDGTLSHSGFVTQSDLSSSMATVSAMLRNPALNIEGWSTMYNLVNTINGLINNALAGLVTRISTLEGNVQTLSTAGFATESYVTGAITTAFADYNGSSSSGNAALELRVTTLEGQVNGASSGLTTRVSTLEGNVLTLSQAGFVTQSDVNSSIATAFANYEGSSSSGGSGSSNAALELRVTDLESASTSLTSKVSTLESNVLTLSQAGFVTQSDVNSSIATLTSRVSTLEGNVQTLSQAGFTTQSLVNDAITRAFANYSTSEGSGDSSLELRVYALENAGFMSEGDLVSAITDRKNDIILSAGLATSAQIDGLSNIYLAKTDLVSEITSKKNDIISNAGLATAAQISNLDDIYLAKTDLVSAITDNKNAIITNAGLATSALISNLNDIYLAKTDLVSAITSKKNDIITNAGLATSALISGLGNTYLAKADLVTAITDKKNLIASSAGLLLTSNLDSSVATLVALNGSNTKAQIELIASDAASSVSINANTIDARVNQILVSGSATFKGDVEASSFKAGGSGEAGIVVQSGSFNPSGADTSKVYFAYDPGEGCPSMFVYDSANSKWRTLSMAKAFKYDDFFVDLMYKYLPTTEYSKDGGSTWTTGIASGTDLTQSPWNTYKYRNGGTISSSATSLSSSNFSGINIYRNQDDSRYYWTENSSVSNRVEGEFIWSFDTSSTPMWQYLGKTADNKAIVAAIDVRILGQRPSFTHGIANALDYSGSFLYSTNAVLSYTIDSNYNIDITSRGAAFVNPMSGTELSNALNFSGSALEIYHFVYTDNKVYSCVPTSSYNAPNKYLTSSSISADDIYCIGSTAATYGAAIHFDLFAKETSSSSNLGYTGLLNSNRYLVNSGNIGKYQYLYTA